MILFPGALKSEMSISILDVRSGDIVSIALEETDLCQNIPWLIQKIEGELKTLMGIPDGKKVHLRELYVGSMCIDRKSQYTIEYYLLDGEVWIMNSVVVNKAMINISINGSDGSVVHFKVKQEVRIAKIIEAYCDRQGFQHQSLRFFFDSRLWDDDLMVHDYDMEDGDVVEVFQQQCGGGCSSIEFADISKTSALKRKTWSKSAPPWRIARRGLCIEGKCTTKSCQAYGQNVIVNVGFGHWELEKYCQSCTCPICCGPVDVATCAFNNCKWKWVGKKVVSPSSPPVVVRGEWKEADDAYHLFEEKESGKAKWLLLKITTEPLGDGSSERGLCAICLSSYSSSEGRSTLPCKHTYHSRCITEWLSRNPTCPLCRAVASMTILMKKATGIKH